MAQNIDFSGSDQIQTPQYPNVHVSTKEKSEEVSQAEGELMKSIQTFLEKFICILFEEKPQILFQAWEFFFAIQHSKHEDPNKLFQKLLEDLKELADYDNSPSRDHPIFLNDDEDHSDQNKESLENSSKEISTSNSNEEKVEPPQDFDIHQLIEECSTKVFEEQKQSMEDTMLELVKFCRQKELLYMHDNVDDLIESALNTKLLSINSQLAPILSTKEPEYSPSMGYEHTSTTPETESDEIINDDDILVYDDFEDIDVEEENVVQQEEEDVDLEDISQIQDIDLREKLLSITRLISNIESLNDNPTPYCALNSSVSLPIFKESDNSISDNFSLEFKIFAIIRKRREVNFADDSEGDVRFLEELLIDDSILSHESSESYFKDNSLIS
nr:hypothetical protein [Tanacetum cinerariifolium]